MEEKKDEIDEILTVLKDAAAYADIQIMNIFNDNLIPQNESLQCNGRCTCLYLKEW